MKQLLQDLRSGELRLENVPAAEPGRGGIVVRTTHSLISAGTERMLTDFAKASYIAKARQQPERLRQVVDKIRADGLMAAYEAVTARLDQPVQLGYSNVGRVLRVGEGVSGIAPGDRVVSNGPHAELVRVTKNLSAKIPSSVSDEAATFTVVSAIALQGIRLLAPALGETVVVSGLGLIGLIAVQLLKANGCRVIGFDPHPERVALAAAFGGEAHTLAGEVDPVRIVEGSTGALLADAVLITASAKSNNLIKQCAQMTRQRGRIVLTGVVGLMLDRADFYEKEITFQVSCSYGPGRYDEAYEQKGQDYPYAFVRWTEQRNFQAVLQMMAARRLDVSKLITHRARFADASGAFVKLSSPAQIGIVLEYSEEQADEMLMEKCVTVNSGSAVGGSRATGVIGAGNFTQTMLAPAIKSANGEIVTFASFGGKNGSVAARRFGAKKSVSDYRLVLEDPNILSVIITTPHNTHASITLEAIRAGKNVFVEKPLCITEAELDEVVATRAMIATERGSAPIIMVGFNRRFAPLARKMHAAAANRYGAPAFGIFTVNAGNMPGQHWTQDQNIGGGRIIGEACHFIDFLRFLVGSRIEAVNALKQRREVDNEDNAAITLRFADGSLGQINYVACGHRSYPKERCQLFFSGQVIDLHNFRRLSGYGTSSSRGGVRQNKGHVEEMAAFLDAVEAGRDSPIPFDEIDNVMRASFAVVRSMRNDGETVKI